MTSFPEPCAVLFSSDPVRFAALPLPLPCAVSVWLWLGSCHLALRRRLALAGFAACNLRSSPPLQFAAWTPEDLST